MQQFDHVVLDYEFVLLLWFSIILFALLLTQTLTFLNVFSHPCLVVCPLHKASVVEEVDVGDVADTMITAVVAVVVDGEEVVDVADTTMDVVAEEDGEGEGMGVDAMITVEAEEGGDMAVIVVEEGMAGIAVVGDMAVEARGDMVVVEDAAAMMMDAEGEDTVVGMAAGVVAVSSFK